MSTAPEPRRGPAFWVAFAIGWCVIAFGAVGLVGAKGGWRGAAEVGAWVAAGHLLHDVVVLPVACLVGFGVARVVGPVWRVPVQAGLVASAVVLAVAYPALRGFGRKRSNPSLLPLDYTTATATVIAVAWALVGLWCAALAWRRRSTRSKEA